MLKSPDGGPAEPAALTANEVRLLSVVLARAPGPRGEETTQPGRRRPTTTGLRRSSPEWTALSALVEKHGGRMEALADGALVVTLVATSQGGGSGTEQATRAAHCALALRVALPEAPIAIATGRGVLAASLPQGEVLDRALRLWRAARDGETSSEPVLTTRPIRIDEVTAGLLDARLEVLADGQAFYLGGERTAGDARRTLLGKPTPCLGRETELSRLADELRQCAESRRARAVVVKGVAGIGKSRVRQELIAQLTRSARAPQVWLARGDPMSAASFGLIGQLIRAAATILESEALVVRRQRLKTRVARHFDLEEGTRVSEFLGELAGIPFPDAGRVQLSAARTDPALLGDQMRRAWEDFVLAECAARPLVLVLEDLHWGDLASVQLLDAALRYLADRPLLVLAFARPSVSEVFPDLWNGHPVEEIALEGLAPAAGRRLIQTVLGPGVAEARVARLIERAGGNAFYLEELIRAVAEGKGEALPGTVMAMVQARLESLDGELRRVARAASTFGELFWTGGVAALLPDMSLEDVQARLDRLCERELVTRRGQGKFRRQEEFAFHHALIREAAYGMLTDDDRHLGHRLAAEWLEGAGESDAIVLAEHWQRGGQPRRAIGCFLRAAEQALGGNDLRAVIARVDRGVRCGAEGETLGMLRLREAEALNWRGELAQAARRGQEAMQRLTPGSAGWSQAAGEVAIASGKMGTPELLSVAEALLEAPGGLTLGTPYVIAAAATVEYLLYAGQEGMALVLLDRLEQLVAAEASPGPMTVASLRRVQATRVIRSGDPGAAIQHYIETTRSFEQAGDLRNAATYRMGLGYSLAEAGAYEESELELRACLAQAQRMGLTNLVAMAQQNLGLVLHRRGLIAEARSMLIDSLEALTAQGDRRMEGGSRVYLARLLMDTGELEAAEREAQAGVELLAIALPLQAHALATLAQIHLKGDQGERALQVARQAMAVVEEIGEVEEGESTIRLTFAEALTAVGAEEARRAIGEARDRLLSRAARISDPRWRRGFLENVGENARTLELAAAWVDRVP